MKDLNTYYIKTYGCAMNYADSERIRFVLNSAGFQETNTLKDADVIILNSCSVRKQAEDKIAGWKIKIRKQNLEEKVFVLTGCMAVRNDENRQEEKKYTSYLKKKYPWINYVLNIKEVASLPQTLGENIEIGDVNLYLSLLPSSQNNIVVNIPVSTGCNFFCSYCIVPFTRGELLHRDYDEILKEVKLNIKNGAKLITLVAQNVNSWKGLKNGKKVSFADLLDDISSLDGDFWVTFISSNPMDFTKEIIDVIQKNKKIMRWINIAVQSGSDDILKQMNRRYSVEEFKSLISSIKGAIPDIRLTTDIIVGFPGESKQDFLKTLDLVKNLKFQMLYIGKYSPREGTLSASFKDDVDIKLKKEREDILKKELNIMRDDFHKAFISNELKVLVTGGKRGISYYYHEVLFKEPIKEDLIGSFVKVKVVDSTLSGLIAKL